MNCLRSYFVCLPAAACLLFATGCMSVRYSTTLPPAGPRDRALGLVKVNVTNLNLSSPNGYGSIVPDMSRGKFMAEARQQYPLIFAEGRDALPVNVEVDCEYDDFSDRAGKYALLTVLTLGLVPTPAPAGGNEAGVFSVRVSAMDPDHGPIEYPAVTFQRRNAAWWTVFTPLGLIPVPGQTDIPRNSTTIIGFEDAGFGDRSRKLTLDSCVEAVVQALEGGDLGKTDIAAENTLFRRDLADLLGNPDSVARASAAAMFGDRGDVRAKEALRIAAYDPEPAVREKSADALRKIGEPPTADELRRQLKLYPALDQYEADLRDMEKSAKSRSACALHEQRMNVLRGRIITLVRELKPAPTIPDEARALLEKGIAFEEKARNGADLELAVAEYDKVLRLAPWWADAYYRRALVEGAVGRFGDAARDLEFYLMSNPAPAAADEARARLAQMQAKREKP